MVSKIHHKSLAFSFNRGLPPAIVLTLVKTENPLATPSYYLYYNG